jgi:hypothetical protein
MEDALAEARQVIDSGKAAAQLEKFIALSSAVSPAVADSSPVDSSRADGSRADGSRLVS